MHSDGGISMKKFLAWLLLVATILSLCGCAAETAPTETAQVPETTLTEPLETQAETLAAQPKMQEGSLFLKVSAITFSVVGESEDIYLGMIPREEVTWESDDPSVVSVENGVLTANGVGTTTIRAVYGEQQVECTAGCLASTQEELEGLGFDVLCTPKRLPPEIDLTEPCSYFDNAAIVGDSITYFLFQWESKTNYLGNMLFLARGGVSMNSFAKRFKNIYYKGKEMNLEDAIAQSQVERVYFLMGSNDISAKTQRPYIYDNWNLMLERIREKSPDVEIVLLSNIPLYGDELESKQERFLTYNTMIEEYNANLRQFAQDNGCMFLDLAYYVKDHCGRMPKIYNQGSYHMNEDGCLNWMKILRHYAQYELEGGTLS